MIKTKIFGIFGGNPAVGAIQRVGKDLAEPKRTPDRVKGIAVGSVDDSYFYQGM